MNYFVIVNKIPSAKLKQKNFTKLLLKKMTVRRVQNVQETQNPNNLNFPMPFSVLYSLQTPKNHKSHDSPVLFDLKSANEPAAPDMPQTKKEYFVNDSLKTLIYKFFDQYFAIFDSENRESLAEAYDDEAKFSISYFEPNFANKTLIKYLHFFESNWFEI